MSTVDGGASPTTRAGASRFLSPCRMTRSTPPTPHPPPPSMNVNANAPLIPFTVTRILHHAMVMPTPVDMRDCLRSTISA